MRKRRVPPKPSTAPEGIALRAALNACVVRINLMWSRAWVQRGTSEGYLDQARLFEASFDLSHGVERLLFLMGRETDQQETRDLVAAMSPRVDLLVAASDELALASRRAPIQEVLARSDEIIQHADAGTARQFQVACILARRYTLLAAPGGLDRTGELQEAARYARIGALGRLRSTVAASPTLAQWAATEPAFRPLADEKDVALVLARPGGGIRIPFRAPWVVPDKAPPR